MHFPFIHYNMQTTGRTWFDKVIAAKSRREAADKAIWGGWHIYSYKHETQFFDIFSLTRLRCLRTQTKRFFSSKEAITFSVRECWVVYSQDMQKHQKRSRIKRFRWGRSCVVVSLIVGMSRPIHRVSPPSPPHSHTSSRTLTRTNRFQRVLKLHPEFRIETSLSPRSPL